MTPFSNSASNPITQGANALKLEDEVVTENQVMNQLKSIENFKDGKRDGLKKGYHENGQLKKLLQK